MSAGELSEKVVGWYAAHHRKLPWRSTNDAYRIWLSEVILQQTRIEQGLPYYLRFIDEFPTVYDLASAKEEKVLRLWQGLGYYSRARHMLRCAKLITDEFGGVFPSESSDLIRLPGIGSYTAAAISSIAFRKPVAVVDGNVYRVLSRLFGIYTPIDSSAGKDRFNQLANELVPETGPGEHNQAMMELGALICTPKNPQCHRCPAANDCVALKKGTQSDLPRKERKKNSRERYFYYFVFQQRKSLLMCQRNGKDIWRGLFDFPMVEQAHAARIYTVVRKFEDRIHIKVPSPATISPVYKHVLSHQDIYSRFLVFEEGVDLSSARLDGNKYYGKQRILDLPKPVLISRFLADHPLF